MKCNDPYCDRCTTFHDCELCKPSYMIQPSSDGQTLYCLASCLNGYYEDKNADGIALCIRCYETCATCKGGLLNRNASTSLSIRMPLLHKP